MEYQAGNYEVIVIGAGHAGIEAALASARLGRRTLMITTNLDAIGNMPCNPSIGGTAKGQLVREIDALGGEMGKAADVCGIQFRMLNRGKGPAVHSPRAQADRTAYKAYMKHTLENCENLTVRQAEAARIDRGEEGRICGVLCVGGAYFTTQAVVVCTGTFLNGRIFIGEENHPSGPDGLYAATHLTDSLRDMGLTIRRFKTGTPARVSKNSIDFSAMEIQQGDEPPQPFSFDATEPVKNSAVCHLTYTNAKTHEVIRGALSRSPLYSGDIHGVGPRYCPSIEDKIVRFSTKERHQIFIEPCGENSGEMYLQGVSTSLPEDIQLKFLRTIAGLEKVEIMRPGYAIEYDCLDPKELQLTLGVREIPGLYAAGQICGTSGYEEAAAQGLLAGANAALWVRGKEEIILDRSDGYLGTLVDDIVTKGTNEPYRMMTSRSEYRLLLRQDNADLRLMPIGEKIGLVSHERVEKMRGEYAVAQEEIRRLEKVGVAPSAQLAAILESCNSAPITAGCRMSDLLRRPELSYEALLPLDPQRPELSEKIREQVEISLKYEGYIKRELREVEEHKRLENRLLPPDLDYSAMGNLRLEARQKLTEQRPRSLGQASRISGVSPSDIAALMIALAQKEERQ